MSFSDKYFWALCLAQFSYLFGLTALHSIGWFHYLLDEGMDLEWIYVGGYLYLSFTTFTQLFLSRFTDNMKPNSKFGRRKPFIAIGFIILAVCIFIMCIPPDNRSTTLGIWWCLFGTVGSIGSDIMNLSLTAWLLENTDDQTDYLRIATKIKTVSQVTGHVLAITLTQYVENGPFIATGLYLFIGAISIILVFKIPNTGITKQDIPHVPPMLPSIRIAANSSLFKSLVSSIICLLSGRDVVAIACLFLFQFANYPEIQTYQDFGVWFFYLTIISTRYVKYSSILF